MAMTPEQIEQTIDRKDILVSEMAVGLIKQLNEEFGLDISGDRYDRLVQLIGSVVNDCAFVGHRAMLDVFMSALPKSDQKEINDTVMEKIKANTH